MRSMAMPDPDQPIGLECKSYWCDKLLDKVKSIELRQYPLPSGFIGKINRLHFPHYARAQII